MVGYTSVASDDPAVPIEMASFTKGTPTRWRPSSPQACWPAACAATGLATHACARAHTHTPSLQGVPARCRQHDVSARPGRIAGKDVYEEGGPGGAGTYGTGTSFSLPSVSHFANLLRTRAHAHAHTDARPTRPLNALPQRPAALGGTRLGDRRKISSGSWKMPKWMLEMTNNQKLLLAVCLPRRALGTSDACIIKAITCVQACALLILLVAIVSVHYAQPVSALPPVSECPGC